MQQSTSLICLSIATRFMNGPLVSTVAFDGIWKAETIQKIACLGTLLMHDGIELVRWLISGLKTLNPRSYLPIGKMEDHC